MYICIYISLWIYIYIYIYIYLYIYIYIYINIDRDIDTDRCAYIYICTYILSIATSKSPSVMNNICINSFRYTHVITSTKLRLKTNVATDEGNSRNEM